MQNKMQEIKNQENPNQSIPTSPAPTTTSGPLPATPPSTTAPVSAPISPIKEKKSKTWIWIVVLIVTILVITVILYFLLGKERESGLKKAYLKYRAELDASKNFDELKEVITKYYSSQKQIREVKIKEIESLEKEFKENFTFIKETALTSEQISIIEEDIEDNNAILIVESKDGTLKGNVNMVKEDGVWKVKEEIWYPKSFVWGLGPILGFE